MAMSGLISNRNFGSFVASGNSYRLRKDVSLQRGGISVSGVSVIRYGNWNGKERVSRCQHTMHCRMDSCLEENVSKQIQMFDNKRELFSPLSRQSKHCSNFKLKACKKSYSYLCSARFGSSNVGQRKVNRFRACYKSEDNDIEEPKIDRLQSTEGTGEAILLEGNLNQISPWWQQFPKRWVIVLLCFTAFLLCNMDRVSNIFFCL
ncbi:unnamed protein product [Vicia faba]|uniref:Uncharacterized protein n=1 Tax=Vicia faba TaxID=3906 RepID=A0AAV1AA09_VICFA|nr:unnamed protein product [Vicia faba]